MISMRFDLPRALILPLLCATALAQTPAAKLPLTLDDFFNSVDTPNVGLAPDGRAVAIEPTRADWVGNRFRSDLWLYRDEPGGSGSLVQLTQSGRDRNPEFSPDGRWIAFLSDRSGQSESSAESSTEAAAASEKSDQVYVISLSGGGP